MALHAVKNVWWLIIRLITNEPRQDCSWMILQVMRTGVPSERVPWNPDLSRVRCAHPGWGRWLANASC